MKRKFSVSTPEPMKCTACGVMFKNHLGIVPTCDELQRLKRKLKMISRVAQRRYVTLASLKEEIALQVENLPNDWGKVR